jgi:hypothetical protein
MRKVILYWLIAAVILLTCACLISTGPAEYTSQAGRFSIYAPAAMRQSKQTVDVEGMSIAIHMFTANVKDQSDMVAYSDYPDEVINQKDPDSLLQSALSGAINNVKGTLISQDDITLDGYPGKEILASAYAANGQEAIMKARFYLVKNRLYMLIMVAPKGGLTREETDSFLDTFKLLPETGQ